MRYRESEEMYLETILLLDEQHGNVRRVDIAAALGYTKASVSVAVKALVEKGLVISDADGFLHLSEHGRAIALDVYEKHHLITQLLVHIGAEPTVAEENACRMEHVISPELLGTIRQFIHQQPHLSL